MSQLLVYEDMGLPCITLMDYQSGENRIRTQFDYGIRQRRKPAGYPSASFNIVLNGRGMLSKFHNFWYKLNGGINSFMLNQSYGPFKGPLEVRFTEQYMLKELGGGLFSISCKTELVDMAQYNPIQCQLLPSNNLYPDVALEPNKCTN